MNKLSKKMQKVLSYRLTKARKRAGLTQLQVANKTKLDPSNISNYERNVRFPCIANIILLSKALSVSVAYLIGETNNIKWKKNVKKIKRL